jgi:hypothetical protein
MEGKTGKILPAFDIDLACRILQAQRRLGNACTGIEAKIVAKEDVDAGSRIQTGTNTGFGFCLIREWFWNWRFGLNFTSAINKR